MLIGKDVPSERNARLLAAELLARIRRGEKVNEVKREERVAARAGKPTLRVLLNQWIEEPARQRNIAGASLRPSRGPSCCALYYHSPDQ